MPIYLQEEDMIDRILLAEILDEALKKGGDFAEIYIEEKVSTSVYCCLLYTSQDWRYQLRFA